MNILTDTFPKNIQKIINTINHTICFFFFSVAAWQIAIKAKILMNTGEVTETLRIIYYPFTYCVAFGCAALALVLFADLIKSLLPEEEGRS